MSAATDDELRLGVAFPAVRVEELAAAYGGVCDPPVASAIVSRLAPIETASAGALSPLTNARYARAARQSAATAVLVSPALSARVAAGRRWVHPSPSVVVVTLLRARGLRALPPRVHPRSVVEDGAEVDPTARIEAGAIIHAGARVGPECHVGPNAVVFARVWLGARVHIGAGSVLGAEGFGFATDGGDGKLVRVPQLGGVVVEDDVEIGPLCTIDAGTLGPTLVGKGAKLDAHVHVGHNAHIGEGAVIAAQSGFAGSAKLGARALVGGQAGVIDHVSIGEGAQIAAKSAVMGDVPAGATYAGVPAVDKARWLRATAAMLTIASRPRHKKLR